MRIFNCSDPHIWITIHSTLLVFDQMLQSHGHESSAAITAFLFHHHSAHYLPNKIRPANTDWFFAITTCEAGAPEATIASTILSFSVVTLARIRNTSNQVMQVTHSFLTRTHFFVSYQTRRHTVCFAFGISARFASAYL